MKLVFVCLINIFSLLVWTCETNGVILLDDKGSAVGAVTPAWVSAYISGSIEEVEKLQDYKNMYCFVAECSSPDKDYAIASVNSIDGEQLVIERRLREKGIVPSKNISSSGVRVVADWWQLINNQKTNEFTYHAYVLWTCIK